MKRIWWGGDCSKPKESLLPWLQEKSKAEDARQRVLAGILIERIREPARLDRWQSALVATGTKFVLPPDGAPRVEIDQNVDYYKANGIPLPVPEAGVAFDADSIWVVLDFARRIPGHSGTSNETDLGRPRTLAILERFADSRAATALIDIIDGRPRTAEAVEPALRPIRDAALPELREQLKECATAWPARDAPDWLDVRRESGESIQRSLMLVRLLVKFEDREGVALLSEKLGDARNPEQMVAFAQALGTFRVPAGIAPTLEKMLDIATGKLEFDDQRDAPALYFRLRPALVAQDRAALEHVAPLARVDQPLISRAIAAGVRFEIEHPERAEAYRRGALAEALAMLVEQVQVDPTSESLLQLARLKDHPLAFEIIVGKTAVPGLTSSSAAMALAEWGDARAGKTLEALVRDGTHHVEPLVITEAALRMGGEPGISVLEAIIQRAKELPEQWGMRSATRLSELALPALRGDDDAWKKLLAEEPDRDANIAEITARTLVAKDDIRGVPVLVRLIVEDPRRYPRYGGEILRLKQIAVEPLERILADSDNLRIRLLCESLVLRIQRPELAARYDEAITFRTTGFMTRKGPDLDDYRANDRQVAALLQEGGADGAAAVPLLELDVLFGSQFGHPGIAAFALAVFQQDRSFDLLVELLETKPKQVRELSILAEALRDFGEQGIEKLKTVPVPQAELPAFITRAGRFRAATEALVEEDPKTALGNVLAGLKSLDSDQAADDPQWTTNAVQLLQTAARFDDPRLVEPVLAVWKRRKSELNSLAFKILWNHDHPAIVDAALEGLALEPDSLRNAYLRAALLRQLRDRTPERLIKELADAKSAERRASAARTLTLLATVDRNWYVVSADETEQQSLRSKAAQAARKPLLAALDDPDAAVQRAAAESLATLLKEYDEPAQQEISSRLVRWMERSRQWPIQVAGPVVETKQRDVMDALLQAFRSSDHADLELA